MKTVITKDGLYKLQIVKIYDKTERFFGKILIKYQDCKTPTRFEIIYFNSIVNDQDMILI
jgi:hypothetical protein